MTPLPFNEKCLILLCLKTRGQSISHGWTRMHTDKNQGLSYRCSSVADLSLPRCQERLILIPRPQESRDSSRRDGPIERGTVPAGSVSTRSSLKLPISRQRTDLAGVQAFSPDCKCLRRSCAREIGEAPLKWRRCHSRRMPLTPPTGERCEAVAAKDLISIDGRPPVDGLETGEGDSERVRPAIASLP